MRSQAWSRIGLAIGPELEAALSTAWDRRALNGDG